MVDPVYFKQVNALDVGETELLALSAGATVVKTLTAKCDKPNPATFIGKGKLDELHDDIVNLDIDLIIFNHMISPIQERNLQRALDCRVIDRTRLILDIFAQRAQSHAGKLQVELAQLKHLSTRLVKGWTHLERQKGGIGLRGPGETQLETDRRLLALRIKNLTRRLKTVERQRQQRSRARSRVPVPVITLVGYTNAGKSTLFNSLVDESVYAADQLFATLDPTMRRCQIEPYGQVIFSDTVGFIQDLPHTLIAAFHSTLEEVVNSTVLLHVVDVSHPDHLEHMDEVERVLEEIGADHIPVVQVFNKIDQCMLRPKRKKIKMHGDEVINSVYISAQKQLGINLLKQVIRDILMHEHVTYVISLTPLQEKIRSHIHQHYHILDETFNKDGSVNMSLNLAPKQAGWLVKQGVQV